MITVEEALAHIETARVLPRVQTVALREAIGKTTAEDITARLTHPPLAASAMDGYAARFKDTSKRGKTLTVIGEAPAGAPFDGHVNAGEVVRIFTGGVLPDGADTIIIQEDVTRTDGHITVDEAQGTPRHIRKAGLDFKTGDVLIRKGTRMGPAEIAIAAAANHAELKINTPLKVAILTGGDELIPPGATPKPGQIINSNPFGLAALIESWGAEAIVLPQAKDSIESILSALERAKDAQIILPVGGASVGDHDYMRRAFAQAGLEMVFEKVAVRPGKPTWFGKLGEACVLGLPGNPASALVCAHIFLRAALGHTTPPILKAQLTIPVSANKARQAYNRAAAAINTHGQLCVTPMPKQDSSLIRPFLTANALMVMPPNSGPWVAGDIVDIISLGADMLALNDLPQSE
ncbi:MAG: gephyrin-like molybdotransferase Glp [Maricaulaceae bacterium]